MKTAIAVCLLGLFFCAKTFAIDIQRAVMPEDAQKSAEEATLHVQFATKPATFATLPVRMLSALSAREVASRLSVGEGERKAQMIGFHRALRESSAPSHTSVETLPLSFPEDAALGIAAVASPGAASLRIAIDLQALPNDAWLAVRGSGDSARVVVAGKIGELRMQVTEDGYWTPLTDGDTQFIEVRFGAGNAPSHVTIRALSHLVVTIAQLNQPGEIQKAIGDSGPCNVNVACSTDTALQQVQPAVARMVYSTSSGSFTCTGTLLNNTAGGFVPYFYSAHHCISSQSVASTLNTFWFFQSTTCTNGPQSPNFAQITGGAAYLWSDSVSDGLLLRLNGTPPAGAVFAAWISSAAPAAGTTGVLGIHHPSGDYKKYSIGTIRSGTCPTNRVCIGWLTGTTEGGSSGSGIFTLDAGEYKLRGGLYGGLASCANTGSLSNSSNSDQYSNFAAIFSNISQWLAPPVTCTVTGIPFPSQTAGTLASTCASTQLASSYARYYTFTLAQATPIVIRMNSSAFNTYLALRSGNSTTGTLLATNDDFDGPNSRIAQSNLAAGTYTIEATTTNSATAGAFNLELHRLSACQLDLDGDGLVRPASDGMLLMRYLLNTTPNIDLTAGARAPGWSNTAATIQAQVNSLRASPAVDVDGDNVVDQKDGMIVLRALLGLRDNAITQGLSFTGSARNTGTALVSWLNSQCGLNLP